MSKKSITLAPIFSETVDTELPKIIKEVTQFNLTVNLVMGETDGTKKAAIEIDLDMNPYLKLFENDEIIFNADRMEDIFKYMLTLTEYLKKKFENDPKKLQSVSRAILKRNSPANLNLSFVTSYNGDVPPPKPRTLGS